VVPNFRPSYPQNLPLSCNNVYKTTMKKCGRTSRLVEFTRVTVNTAGHELGLIYFDSARLPWPNFTSRIFYALKDPLSCWLDVLDVAITISTSSVRFKFPNNFKVWRNQNQFKSHVTIHYDLFIFLTSNLMYPYILI
jgi:hypothetical protein